MDEGRYNQELCVITKNSVQLIAQVDVYARVIDSNTWKPIPGLYVGGEVTGGMYGFRRLGICSIPDCVVMGMTAARSMMKSSIALNKERS